MDLVNTDHRAIILGDFFTLFTSLGNDGNSNRSYLLTRNPGYRQRKILLRAAHSTHGTVKVKCPATAKQSVRKKDLRCGPLARLRQSKVLHIAQV